MDAHCITHARTLARMHACTHTHLHTCTHAHTHARMHAHTHARTRTHLHACTHGRMHPFKVSRLNKPTAPTLQVDIRGARFPAPRKRPELGDSQRGPVSLQGKSVGWLPQVGSGAGAHPSLLSDSVSGGLPEQWAVMWMRLDPPAARPLFCLTPCPPRPVLGPPAPHPRVRASWFLCPVPSLGWSRT